MIVVLQLCIVSVEHTIVFTPPIGYQGPGVAIGTRLVIGFITLVYVVGLHVAAYKTRPVA